MAAQTYGIALISLRREEVDKILPTPCAMTYSVDKYNKPFWILNYLPFSFWAILFIYSARK